MQTWFVSVLQWDTYVHECLAGAVWWLTGITLDSLREVSALTQELAMKFGYPFQYFSVPSYMVMA